MHLIAPVAMVAELVLGGPASGVPASRVVAAQASSATLSAATDRQARAAGAARQRLQSLAAHKRALLVEYHRRTRAIDQLSRQRASWNRDRKIRNLKSEAQRTAKQLAALDRQLGAAKKRLHRTRQALLAAVERELANGASGARAGQLRKLRHGLARALRPPAHKIIVPDGELDLTADPEELEEQMHLIARAERQLQSEAAKLDRLEKHYAHQEALRRQRRRAHEIGQLDRQGIRRAPGIGAASERSNGAADSAEPGAGGSDGVDGDAEPPPSDADPGTGSTAALSLETSSVVLADVIDEVTAADLRRASRSTNPSLRARAARKAQREVGSKLEELRRQRHRIEKRVRSLRR